MAEVRRESCADLHGQSGIMLAAETLRNASNLPAAGPETKEEKSIPLVWRIFGGTVLSIGAMLAVTLYSQLSAKVDGLTSATINKDEFFALRKYFWDRLQSVQSQGDATDTELKQRCARLEEQVKINEQLRQEIVPELKQIRDTMIAYLKDSSAQLEQQVKTSEAERKKLADEVHALQERLVKMATRPPEIRSAVFQK
jgi:hypothetical protein